MKNRQQKEQNANEEDGAKKCGPRALKVSQSCDLLQVREAYVVR